VGRIYDYSAYSASKKGGSRGDYSFGIELKYSEIDIFNKPEEYAEIDDVKAFVEYSIDLIVKKAGIDDFLFNIDGIELEFSVDDYPNSPREFDIDLIPGKTIDYSQLNAEKLSSVIPTYPNNLSIDMNKSTDPKNFKITVSFGNDYVD
jgi:hypothetical protein